MPIYAYRCSSCGHAQDVLQKMSDPLLTVCPACNATAYTKQLTAAGFQLKGSGWYVTDFRGGNTAKPDAKNDDKADAKTDAKNNDKADAKTDAAAAPSTSGASGDGRAAAAPAGAPAAAAPAASSPAAAAPSSGAATGPGSAG